MADGRHEGHSGGRILLLGSSVVLIYLMSYLVLTLGGAYAGSVYGLRVDKDGKTIVAPKWYSWAPAGFETEGTWNQVLVMVYLPLYWLDTRCWHTDDRRFSGSYPVHLHPADIR